MKIKTIGVRPKVELPRFNVNSSEEFLVGII